MAEEFCLMFPRPIFFELGIFGGSNEIQQRLIKNKYIYAITGFDPLKCDIFITDDKGMIFFEKEKEISPNTFLIEKTFAVIHPGQYYFFVSKYKVLDYSFFNTDNCTPLIEITTEWDQLISLPYPMCAHNNGAENVANYILDEIKNNSSSVNVINIKERLNVNRVQAKLMFMNIVGRNKIWDHKQYISGEKEIINKNKYNMVKNSVLRPISKNGLIRNGVFHKYNDFDIFYDVWSNIHYGYLGKVCGFNNDEILDYPGLEQLITDIYNWLISGFSSQKPKIYNPSVKGARKFDDIPDQISISLGIVLFMKTNGNPNVLSTENILDSIDGLCKEGLFENACVKHICYDDNDFSPYKIL